MFLALPDPSVLAPFILAVVIIALTPGPDMTFFVGRALTQGRTAGLAALAGATSGILVHTAAVTFGLSELIVAAPRAFMALKIVGAVYLLWLALQAIRHGSALTLPKNAVSIRSTLARTWATGVGINLLNPKIVLFFMTFLPQFVSANDPQAPQRLFALGLLFICVATLICVPMVLAADGFAATLRRNPRITRIIDWVFASVFCAFAVQILLSRAR